MAKVNSISYRMSHFWAKWFPERRIFLRSDKDTRFIQLTPGAQVTALVGSIFFVAWSIVATSILMMDTLGSGNLRDQALREQLLYEKRLNEISAERDMRALDAEHAHDRFNLALDQISQMQLALLASEDRRKEMEKGIEVIQQTLRRTIKERDAARIEFAQLQADLQAEGPVVAGNPDANIAETVDFLTAALGDLAAERDAILVAQEEARDYAQQLELEQKLLLEKNDRIFTQLEDAVSLSMTPIDEMFRSAGMSTDRILNTVRSGYSGQGGPLMPLTFSTKGAAPDADSLRANAILEGIDRMNLYRIAAEKVPFSMPLKTAFRRTSGFGPRWGKMHEGEDMAGAYGSPVYATADGVVIKAGNATGYGRLIKIKHEFGIETRFAHLARIRVKVGQKVSRGEQIGDMGNSGLSTGTHLHYEIRQNGEAVNPMTYIKAGQNVF